MWHNPSMDSDAYITSWQLSLHDKAESTRRMYGEELRRFDKWLPAGRSLVDVKRKDVQSYLGELRAQGRAQATIRARWLALRSFYAWAAVEDEVDDNPILAIKVARAEPPPPKFPTDQDVALLLKVCAGKGLWERRDSAMIRISAATGMRVSEMCGLEIQDIDLAQRVAAIRHGKGDRARFAKFDTATGAAVDRYLRARSRHKLATTTPRVFITRYGPMNRKSAAAMLQRRCEQAGIDHINWHAFRHRFAHTWLSRGGQEGDLARLGGWTDPAVMRRYGSALATERALDAYDELGGVL
jgi:integrase/recombinase XerD